MSGRVMTARHPGPCRICPTPIRPGDLVVFYGALRGRGVVAHAGACADRVDDDDIVRMTA